MESVVNDIARVGGMPGAVATAHPRATEAALSILADGGSAVDAAICAQAVIAVVLPQAAGLGGDMLGLVRTPSGIVHAINGTGLSPRQAPSEWTADGGGSVTVPGAVDAWSAAHGQWGRLPLRHILAPAIEAARSHRVDASVVAAAEEQRARLITYGAERWTLLQLRAGDSWSQPELADLLTSIVENGSGAFYCGPAAQALVAAVVSTGGSLSLEDLESHGIEVTRPVEIPWNDGRLYVQPPSSQGVLLAMAAQWLDRHYGELGDDEWDHVLVEVTEAAFEHRDDAAGDANRLLSLSLEVDRSRAGRRGGPRGYLHTAGVAVADSEGWVVSSLVSVFDDFGSAVYVPELGIVLNNRAAGFTAGENAPRPRARPVHTLAPALLVDRHGQPLALATPGADGQVQTLVQVISALRRGSAGVDAAVRMPRWRSQDGTLLIERGHPARAELEARGHDTVEMPHGDPIFGAMVAAGIESGRPFAAADPRRNVSMGVR